MSTETCAAFLVLHAPLIGEPEGQAWTELGTRTEEGATVRKFISPQARIVELADVHGAISLVSADFRMPAPKGRKARPFGALEVGTEPTDRHVVAFLIDCLRRGGPANFPEVDHDESADLSNWDVSRRDVAAMEISQRDLHQLIDLPYEGQVMNLTLARCLRIFELSMPLHSDACTFELFLDREGILHLGHNIAC